MGLAICGVATVFLTGPASGSGAVGLVDPAAPLEREWKERAFGEPTDYETVQVEGRPAIKAFGKGTASGLYREVSFSVGTHPLVRWSWRVDRLQSQADIRRKEKEDFAAAIFFLFERPTLADPDVPVLGYVWANGAVAQGSVVPSPRRPKTIRSIVVEEGGQNLGRWLEERRNVRVDYRRAFGEEPPGPVKMVALWTDSDQTGQSVLAYYGPAAAVPAVDRRP